MTGDEKHTAAEHQERELTDEEIREVRAIIEADKRANWLWALIRTGSIWVAAVLGALMLTWEAIVKALRAIISP